MKFSLKTPLANEKLATSWPKELDGGGGATMIRADLSRLHCPVPTLIDGKMRPLEWVQTNSTLLNTDFEHHGLGKIGLSVTDPTYDH